MVVEPVRFPSPDQDNSFLMDDLPLISPPYRYAYLSHLNASNRLLKLAKSFLVAFFNAICCSSTSPYGVLYRNFAAIRDGTSHGRALLGNT